MQQQKKTIDLSKIIVDVHHVVVQNNREDHEDDVIELQISAKIEVIEDVVTTAARIPVQTTLTILSPYACRGVHEVLKKAAEDIQRLINGQPIIKEEQEE